MRLADCHPTRKHQARGMCAACYAQWNLARNPELRARQYASSSRWQKANRDKTALNSKRARRRRTPEQKRAHKSRALFRRFGITIDDYDRMLHAQNGGCALCSRKPGRVALHVDHDHSTGKVRGLLCHQCNWYMGTVDADAAILERIKEYRV